MGEIQHKYVYYAIWHTDCIYFFGVIVLRAATVYLFPKNVIGIAPNVQVF